MDVTLHIMIHSPGPLRTAAAMCRDAKKKTTVLARLKALVEAMENVTSDDGYKKGDVRLVWQETRKELHSLLSKPPDAKTESKWLKFAELFISAAAAGATVSQAIQPLMSGAKARASRAKPLAAKKKVPTGGKDQGRRAGGKYVVELKKPSKKAPR